MAEIYKVNRRQFQDPTDDDLNDFLDTVNVVFVTSTWDGSNMYVDIYYQISVN